MIRDTRCPNCGHRLSQHEAADLADTLDPRSGDVALCIYCGQWGVFQRDLSLRKPNIEEVKEIGLDADCVAAYRAWERTFPERVKHPTGKGWGS